MNILQEMMTKVKVKKATDDTKMQSAVLMLILRISEEKSLMSHQMKCTFLIHLSSPPRLRNFSDTQTIGVFFWEYMMNYMNGPKQ